ncbi:Multiple organellar RNA editing factor 1 [Cardamine amara subsp. amara]|uniref:Multiple organellar RNA editing factor 1 n=1 Tax=Cardamine amara subsp. amara TaxID=228776 RepID=A0ABD1C2S3_CARAN
MAAMFFFPLRRALLTTNSSFNRYVSRSPVRLFSTKLYDKADGSITKDTLPFEGCDYKHWLITMCLTNNMEIIECASVFGISLEEAEPMVYTGGSVWERNKAELMQAAGLRETCTKLE